MRRRLFLVLVSLLLGPAANADLVTRTVDIPTRPGVTQRILMMTPASPKAVAVLFAGGHGGLKIGRGGTFAWGGGNFLVRSRGIFARLGLVVAVVDTPSDRPHLDGFRQSRDHAADIQALIAWLRKETGLPVWLIGTSRGTQSVGYLATAIAPPAGPDGIVLIASILTDEHEPAVSEMPLERLDMPVLVVHHRDDGCRKCLFRDMPRLMARLEKLERKELMVFTGGRDEGDACRARAHHGFNGLEENVVTRIAGWIETENSRLAGRRRDVHRN